MTKEMSNKWRLFLSISLLIVVLGAGVSSVVGQDVEPEGATLCNCSGHYGDGRRAPNGVCVAWDCVWITRK